MLVVDTIDTVVKIIYAIEAPAGRRKPTLATNNQRRPPEQSEMLDLHNFCVQADIIKS